NQLRPTTLACARNAGGTMLRASSLLSTSTSIHALWSPSLHPQSARDRKWDPVLRKTSTTLAQATVDASWGTSMRNLFTSDLLRGGRWIRILVHFPAVRYRSPPRRNTVCPSDRRPVRVTVPLHPALIWFARANAFST